MLTVIACDILFNVYAMKYDVRLFSCNLVCIPYRGNKLFNRIVATGCTNASRAVQISGSLIIAHILFENENKQCASAPPKSAPSTGVVRL